MLNNAPHALPNPSISFRWIPVLTVLTLLLASGCDGLTGSNDAAPPSFTTEVTTETVTTDDPKTQEVDQGQYADIEDGLKLVIHSEAEYADIWSQLHGHQDSIPDRPTLNFEEESLVVIVMESQPTGGYDVTIDEVLLNEAGDQAQIRYTETSPGETCSVTMARTSPYLLATIDVPVDTASFEASTEVRSCPPSE